MNKKAQGLSMETIVIAVIVLIVLAVLSIIFIGKMGIFGKSATDCQGKAKGAVCKAQTDGCPADYASVSGLCPKEQICCVPLNVEQ
jgi:cell division protein FtsN